MGSDSSTDYHKFNQVLIQNAAFVSDVVSIHILIHHMQLLTSQQSSLSKPIYRDHRTTSALANKGRYVTSHFNLRNI